MGIIQTTKKLRPRQENDFYPTPIELCRAALDLVFTKPSFIAEGIRLPRSPSRIIDPGCGSGVWGQVARELWPKASIEGVDICPGWNEAYDQIHEDNFLGSPLRLIHYKYDMIIGNPPYRWAEQFIRQSWDLLDNNGTMVLLLRLAFLEGQKRGRSLWKEIVPESVHVLTRRPSFTGNQKTDATAYAIYVFDKPVSELDKPTLHWLDWDYDK